jgi:uncharacterized protein (UPF0332 family)
MTIEEKDRNNLTEYRLEQAKETILDVELLVENKRFRSAINLIYYGMFYALLDEMKDFILEISSFIHKS